MRVLRVKGSYRCFRSILIFFGFEGFVTVGGGLEFCGFEFEYSFWE